MPGIYEALLRAAEEREALKKRRTHPRSPEESDAGPAFQVEEEMLGLFEALASTLPQSGRASIQFMGSEGGAVASNMAREYAAFWASATGRSVLLLEAEKTGSGTAPSASLGRTGGETEGGAEGQLSEKLFDKLNDRNLFVSKTISRILLDAADEESPSKNLLWTLLKDRFDLIVISAAPQVPGSKNLGPAPRFDGVLLIFESDLALTQDGPPSDAPGLSSILEEVARGALVPQRVETCMGAKVLILTPAGG